MLYKVRTLIYILLLVPASLGWAEEGVDDVLQRHVVKSPIKMIYQQTRHIQFVQDPMVTSGKIYITPLFFIMEQQQPVPLVVASDHKHLWAHNLKTGKKYDKSVLGLKRHDPAVDALIKAFLTGDMTNLKKHFTVKLEKKIKAQWLLTFTPKSFQAKHKYEIIAAKGLMGERLSSITIKHKHGNIDLWSFQYVYANKRVKQEINHLLQVSGKP